MLFLVYNLTISSCDLCGYGEKPELLPEMRKKGGKSIPYFLYFGKILRLIFSKYFNISTDVNLRFAFALINIINCYRRFFLTI